MTRRYGNTLTFYQDVEVEVEVDDLIEHLSKEEIRELFNDAFGVGGTDSWTDIYENRRRLSTEAFLEYIDRCIMDETGRILV